MEGKTLNIDDLRKGYLTNRQSDSNALAHLDFVSRYYTQPESMIIQIFSMDSDSFTKYLQDEKGIALLVSSNTHSELADLLKSEGFSVTDSGQTSGLNFASNNPMQVFVPYVLFIAVGACACLILNENKKIRILAIQGLHPAEIFCELFAKFYAFLLGLCAAAILGTYLFLAGDFRPVTHKFLQETGQIAIEILLLICCIALLTWLYVFLSVRSLRSDQKKTQKIAGTMLAVQLLCMAAIIPLADVNSKLLVQNQQRLDYLSENRDSLLSYSCLGGLSTFEESSKTRELIGSLMKENGVIYLSSTEVSDEYNSPYYYEMKKNDMLGLDRIEANLNWLKSSEFSSSLIDPPQLSEEINYVLIPERAKENTSEILEFNQGFIPIYYQTGQEFHELNYSRTPLIRMDPVIYILSKWEPGTPGVRFNSAGTYYLPTNSSEINKLQEDLKKNGLEDMWIDRQTQFSGYMNTLKQIVNQQKMNLILSVLILLVLLYAVIRIYLVENEKYALIRTITGAQLKNAVSRFVLLIAPVYLLTLCWLFFTHQFRLYTLPWTAGIFILQTGMFALMYKTWQKKELPKMLREE